MKTKFDKNLSFLKPFLKGISKIVPIYNVGHIKSYRVAKGLTERGQASIVKHSYKNYTINLKTQALVNKGKEHQYETLEQILLDLAHELSHLLEWDHTSKHFKIQSKIMLHFARKLRKNGIEDHSMRINRIRSKNGSNGNKA